MQDNSLMNLIAALIEAAGGKVEIPKSRISDITDAISVTEDPERGTYTFQLEKTE